MTGGASGRNAIGDSVSKSMSTSPSVSDAADAAEEEAKREKGEIFVDFYTLSLRLAKIGSLLCSAFSSSFFGPFMIHFRPILVDGLS